MRVSIIVAAYNAEKTIGLCLAALLDQSFPDSQYEVIVVDDGSTDDTPTIVQGFEVSLFRQKNQGPGVARNLGAKEAAGEIILFTDSDCEPDHHWVEEMYRAFENEAENIIGAKGFYRTRQQQIAARFAQIEYENKYDLVKKEKYIDFIDTYSAGYRRDVFLDNGGFDSIYTTASGEDSELSYRLALRGCKLVVIPDAIVYHKHPDTLMKYLKKKFRNAYWRAVTWKKHPQKILKDSHTPQTLKAQIVLCGIMVFFAMVIPLNQSMVYAFVISAGLFFLSTLPFTFKALQKDVVVGFLSPFFLFLRSIAFILGVITRALSSTIGKLWHNTPSRV